MGGNLAGSLNQETTKETDLVFWHLRYRQQARWTADVRNYLIKKTSLKPGGSVLEVGMGTGAVLSTITKEQSIHPFGVDLNRSSLDYAEGIHSAFRLIQGDGHRLPFPDDIFDLTYCHYLLLWVDDPTQILREMLRVTRSGGFVIALAEPDHASRIDYPPPLDHLGRLQTEALADQGVDITLGRKLKAFFTTTGFSEVETGLLGAQWTEAALTPEETEWGMVQSDLGARISEAQLAEYQQINQAAYRNGERVLFIPTFYAIGRV